LNARVAGSVALVAAAVLAVSAGAAGADWRAPLAGAKFDYQIGGTIGRRPGCE
jgi:hypothetical protein